MVKKEIRDRFFELCYNMGNLEEFENFLKEHKEELKESEVLENGLSWVVSSITEYSQFDKEEKKVKFEILIKDIKTFKHSPYFISALYFESKDYTYINYLIKYKAFKKAFIDYLQMDCNLIMFLKERNDVEEKLKVLSDNKIYIDFNKKDIPQGLHKAFERYLLQGKVIDF